MTDSPLFDGGAWLSAALSGGLPEPVRERWQPLRVGIVNLWEYDDAEFWFADGRLVLRGGNGAGKTKVLELTTLMLLRGETAPSVLDPFGTQHRTMRFNLLPTGEGDDPRPMTDSGLGYAWAEYGRRDEQGRAHFFVCGLGASARRGSGTSGVSTWRFVTDRRPGKELRLTVGGRPLDEKELKRTAGVSVVGSAAEYRRRLAVELFGLEPDAYDNLTALLKQLRKPKLGERLNPSVLAETLREALPPLATNEINQLADGWDRLEALRRAVDETRQAATQVATFVRSAWRPWARAVVRRRANTLAAATTTLDNTTRDRREADARLTEAQRQVAEVATLLKQKKQEHGDTTTALRELLDSAAYRDAASAAVRVDNLTKELRTLQRSHQAAQDRAKATTTQLRKAEQSAAMARQAHDAAQAEASRLTTEAQHAADAVGLGPSAARHLLVPDLDAARSDLERRTERARRLRELHKVFSDCDREAEKAADQLKQHQDTAAQAEREAAEALDDLQRAVADVQRRLRDWAASTEVARCTDEQVEDWCDLAAALAETEPEEDAPARSVTAAVQEYLRHLREELLARRAEVARRREPVAAERARRAEELADVEASTESPPPAPALWRRRDRPSPEALEGAPLWRCVQPRAEVAAADLDLVETALAASGLLDAWLLPDGRVLHADGADVLALAGPPVADEGLQRVLEPTPAGGVSAATIDALLRSIGWLPSAPSAQARSDGQDRVWLAADGGWRLGPLTGRVEVARTASYLGATAREDARRRRIAELTAAIAALDGMLAELDAERSAVAEQLDGLKRDAAGIPPDVGIIRAAEQWRVLAARAGTEQARVVAAEEQHRLRCEQRDAAWAAVAEHAAEHGLPLQDLDAFERALTAYGAALGELTGALGVLRARREADEGAMTVLQERTQELETARSDIEELAEETRAVEVRVRTAAESLLTGHQQQLDRRNALEADAGRLNEEIEKLTTRHGDEREQVAKAQAVLDGHEERRRQAEVERDAAIAAWWRVVDAGLMEQLGLEMPDRRSVETARDSARAARRALDDRSTSSADNARDDAAAEDGAWRRCVGRLQQLRQELLPERDARINETLDPEAIEQVVILTDGAGGWKAPHDAADELARRVREQETRYDAEQQQVLTTLLGSTFIEHLKDRLDYTERTFNDINGQLTEHATRHGHAVRLRWEADRSDPHAEAVVAALSQGYRMLSPGRQQIVRDFLARRIAEARAEAAAEGRSDWKDLLAAALDYRRWLRITLQFRPGAQAGWAPFDTARHGAKSGGEKVILLSQPLFAAAVVAYNAAGPLAPRSVWLDEAMTGVDAEIKSRFMGLTVGFDLDVMLTAHDEWCTYATVPAVAVYDLARQEHLAGVDAMPYLWCGGDLRTVEFASADSDAAADLAGEGSLFAAVPGPREE